MDYELMRGRTVLVTGATGFIGSHLTEILTELGADTRILIRQTSNMQYLQGCIDKLTIYKGDVTDRGSLTKALKDIKMTGSNEPIIFHLAAQAHVKESWTIPHVSFQTNVVGTLNLLEAIKDIDLKIYKMTFAGSSEEYGNQPQSEQAGNALNELSPIAPISPYGVTKVSADFLCQNYVDAYGIPISIVRMFNNFGPRQRLGFITPTIISQALSNPIIKLGDLRPRRDFLYVRDGAYGHIATALGGIAGDVYCIGFGKTISMADWADKIIKIGQKNQLWEKVDITLDTERFRPGNSELRWLKVDNSKLTRTTGWHTKYSWDEGLELTVKWFEKNRMLWRQ